MLNIYKYYFRLDFILYCEIYIYFHVYVRKSISIYVLKAIIEIYSKMDIYFILCINIPPQHYPTTIITTKAYFILFHLYTFFLLYKFL